MDKGEEGNNIEEMTKLKKEIYLLALVNLLSDLHEQLS
jgi:hypothetical protein